MLTSGFTNAPVSKFLLFALVASSLLISIADVKYLFYIQVVPHLWRYRQGWRLLVWQTCYTNSTEALFATMLLYHLRVVERLWGTRKFASFLLSTLPYNMLLPPMLLALVVRPLTFDRANYLPAGPTPIIFSLLAQYHAAIPHMYRFKIAAASTQPGAVIFSSKSFTYLLAFQLAFSSFPGSALSALVGWCVGSAWRNELLPGAAKWRIPGWLMRDKAQGQRFEGLRRRLEGEEAVAAASGAGGRERGEGRQRRTLGSQILDQFRGNF